MTNKKHTPGCEGDRYGCPRCKPDKWGILNETDCGCIAETLSDGEVVVHHCHEHAAAPELLAALEPMCDPPCGPPMRTGPLAGTVPVYLTQAQIDAMRSALAKARCES